MTECGFDSDDPIELAKVRFDTVAEELKRKMQELEEHGKLYTLQPEEIDMLKTFRKFKSLIKRPATFKFLTRPYETTNKG